MSFFAYMLAYNRYVNCLGIAVVLFILWIASTNRAGINYRQVFTALCMQFLVGVAVLKTAFGAYIVGAVARAVGALYGCAEYGTVFMFGNLINQESPWGFIFACKVLPILIFFGAFMSLLFYWGIVQRFVGALSYLIRPLLGTSGAETLCAIANSFLDQTGSPLLIKHYLRDMTTSEMVVVMISGMATISGAILVVFAAMGVPIVHLLSASVMAIPASILVAKIICPETERPRTMSGATVTFEQKSATALDAIATGTIDGLTLALHVGAMLISFIALIGLANCVLSFGITQFNAFCAVLGVGGTVPIITLQTVFAYLFAPFGYLFGFTGSEALAAGELIGTKVAVNEVVAYSQMVTMGLSQRTVSILTYALCGFSNFSCIGIQIGGIGSLVPEKRHVISRFGLRAVMGGAAANILSAMVAGLLL